MFSEGCCDVLIVDPNRGMKLSLTYSHFAGKQTLWKLKLWSNINFKLQCNFRNFWFWNSNLVWRRPRITKGLTLKWKIFLKFVQELVLSIFLFLNLLLTEWVCCLFQSCFYRKTWICIDLVPFRNCQDIISQFNRKVSGITGIPAAVFPDFISYRSHYLDWKKKTPILQIRLEDSRCLFQA